MDSLVLRDLSKNFNSTVAVDRANLSAKDEELLVIAGESSYGKTTFLRLITGLETPDNGHVFIGGVPVNDVPTGQRCVQMIFQNFALWPHMKIFDDRRYTNLSLPLKVRKWSQERIHQFAHEVVMGLPDRGGSFLPQTHRAIGRGAAEGGPGSRHDHGSPYHADGRAVEQPRSHQSIEDAPGNPLLSQGASSHDTLCHP
tara:strand:- start:1 stop:597 length:597 start_codon:yes stop_codon:yes gene_type:complete